MAHHGTVKAGHGGSAGGGNNGGPFKDDPAAGAVRENAADENVSSMFGAGQSEAEAQLRNYRDLMTNSKPGGGFAPMDELHARLSEEPSLLNPPADEFDFGPFTDDGWPDRQAHGASCLGYEYFDSRFLELKRLMAKKDEGTREIEQIKASLGEILVRLEKISTDMPSGATLTSVETKITAMSSSIEAAREHSADDANRISRAAEEILAASVCMHEIPAKFEMAARHTVEGLGRTVAASASRAAAMAVSQVCAGEGLPGDAGATGRMEEELRTLNRQSRETGERTAAALDRVNNTLRDYLGRGPTVSQAMNATEHHKKRTGLHVPISGDSAVYKRGGTGFGASPAPEPRLDTIQLRDNPPASDPNLYEAIRKANEELGRKKPASTPDSGGGLLGGRPAFAGAANFLDDDKSVPLGGIATVAFVLLMAAAALFYLHTKGRMDSVRLSDTPAAVRQIKAPEQAVRTAAAVKTRIEQNGPTLLAASQEGRAALAAAEELEALEAAARQGDRDAQFRVGTRFLNGTGLDGGPEAAARWFAKAAEKGHNEAQFMLASLYERGEGVKKDEATAIALYKKAAGAGHVRAMHNLGAMLLKQAQEQSVHDAAAAVLSYREAGVWFERAAKVGFADSQYNLAVLYERGLGIEQDLLRAYQWYVQAAKAGVKEAAIQAERLRRTMPSAQNSTGAGRPAKAGSWKPVLMDTASTGSTFRG
jgi:localization factor PodJL